MEAQNEQELIAERLATCRRLLSRLVHFDAPPSGDPGEAYRTVTQFAAELLRVARVSVWRLDAAGERLICVDVHDVTTSGQAGGGVLAAAAAPSYFRALRSQRCVAASDALNDPATQEFRAAYLEPNRIGALLDAPIWVGGQLAGVVCHEHVGGPRRWTFGDELLAGTMADFLARVLEAAERRRAERDLSAVRHSEHHLRALLAAAPVALLLVTGSDHRVLAVNRRAAALLEFEPVRGREQHLADLIVDAEQRTRLLSRLDGPDELEGEIARVRTRGGSDFWALASARSLELDGHRYVLLGLTDMTRQKELERQLIELATRDGLTGAYTRRTFVEHAEQEIGRAGRTGAPLSLCMLDADHFKQVNDAHGHFVGDQALSALASTAAAELRSQDAFGRMGGEEFAILLPETELSGAQVVAERVRVAIAGVRVPTDSGDPVLLSVSIGVAQHVPGERLEQLLRRADAALYRAKAAGRDRVVV